MKKITSKGTKGLLKAITSFFGVDALLTQFPLNFAFNGLWVSVSDDFHHRSLRHGLSDIHG